MYNSFRWTRASLGRNTLTKAYEPVQPFLLAALAEQFGCDSFLDIGANIGAYSLLLSRVPTIRTVHAFEASPETFEELARNVALNTLQREITCHQKAVSDANGTLRFGIINTLSGANSVVSTSVHTKFESFTEVEAVALDGFLTLRDRKVCIKIDVEGHEREVLAGMNEVLSQNSVLLQVEDLGPEESELSTLLNKLGLWPLCRIGPDRYFASTSMVQDASELIPAFQKACEQLRDACLSDLQKHYGPQGESPVTVDVGPVLSFTVKGRAARAARFVRRLLRGRS